MGFFYYSTLLLVSSVLYLYWYVKKTYSFFEQMGVPYIKPTFLFGNTADVILLRKSMAEEFADLYEKLKPHRLAGIFIGTKPMVLIRDPELLKDVLIKDYPYFSERGWHVDHTVEPLSDHLFTRKGDDWKNLRIKLNPVFTSGKMKIMFPLVKACGEKLCELIDRTDCDESFDAKDLLARYTTDVIGSCAFGLDTKAMDDPNAEFRIMGRKLSKFRLKTILRILQFDIPQRLIKLLKITLFDLKTQNYFGNIIYKTIVHREKTNEKRNDLIDLLIEMKNNETYVECDARNHLNRANNDEKRKSELKITDQLLAAQGFIFFFAGFETSSTNLSYILLELSKKENERVQDKVRKEIVDILSANNGQLTYDVLKQMTYTDMVIDETLRKYPPNAILQRRAVKNYKVPNSNIVIPAGTSIVVSILGLHWDEKYFDNPQEFRPERFGEEEKSKQPNYTYMPFGAGPRYCIGARFAKMTVKIGLIYALRNYSYRTSPDMKFPLKFDRNLGLLTPCNAILLQRDIIK